MDIIKRSESPIPLAPSDRSRRQSLVKFSAPGHHQMMSFTQFPYENGMSSFTLPRMGEQSPTKSEPPSIYSHHPSASYHLNPAAHSGFSSPTSNHSSPNPYGDFNAFPLSPPNSGTTLSSLMGHQQNSSHGHLSHLPPQPLPPFDLSSTISSTGACEIAHSSHPCDLPLNRHARRESYSTNVTAPSYERRHSTVSVGSMRSLHSNSPYTAHAPSDTHPGAQSQIYTLAGDFSSQGVFYIDSGRHAVPASSEMTSPDLMQPGMMSDVPRLAQSPILHMSSTVPTHQPQSTKLTTRQYRKKTPPDCCAVCEAKSTPEWRKGPSGLRTLCNACGLTAAKHPLPVPTCIEEVWAQLREIGISRHRGGTYELDERKKAAAARKWASQSQTSSRASNHSPYAYTTTTSPTSKSCRSSFPHATGAHAKTSTPSHPMDPTRQLFTMNRGRGNSLDAGLPGGSGALSSPGNVVPMHSYSVTSSPHAASLTMGSENEADQAPPGSFPHPLSSPLWDSTDNYLDFYASPLHSASGMNPQSSRRSSIGGDRMSISSIINQDPPGQARCFDDSAHVPPLHQTPHLHHPFFLQHPPHSR